MKNTKIGKSHMTIDGKKVGNYILRKVLGQGQFGKVWKAIHAKNGKEFAIKKIDKSKINSNPILKRLLKTEVSIMHEIHHPNILHLHDFLESKNNYYLVVDLCNKGDFENYLKMKNVKCLPEKDAVYFLKQIMNGFQELRKKKVLHRDFKLANLFINDETLIIGDFGFAKSGQEMAETKLGTPLTMAYEILTANDENSSYTSKADLWSVGVVYYQMLFGQTPFFGFTMPDLIKDIKKKVGNLPFPKPISNESKDLINRLLKTNPKERIDWYDFFNHPLFKKYSSEIKGLDDVFSALGNLMIGDNTKIDKEFQKNQTDMNVDQNVNFMDQQNLLNYGEKKPMQAKNIEEQSLDDRSRKLLEKESAFREISFRYNHEKNKILFLVYTVKKIQKSIKFNYFLPMKHQLLNISLLLLKKALVLNNCNESHLVQGNNVFNLNENFFKGIKSSPKYKEIVNTFKVDKNNFMNYLGLIIERAKENNITIVYQNIINQPNPQLVAIDNHINQLYFELRNYTTSTELQNPQVKKFFFLILVSIKFCVECEQKFPYLDGVQKSKKFNWSNFYGNHENSNIYDLSNKI